MKLNSIKIKIPLAAFLLLLASCANKDYIYYKSKCACKEIPNHANIKKV